MKCSNVPRLNRTVGHSLQTKFSFGIIVILVVFTCLLSYGVYKQLKQSLIRNSHEKSQVILAELEATRKYVAEILRPRISSLVSVDEFVLEAMSTTYVSRQIMDRFQSMFPEFIYKRAAKDPRNSMNQADVLESEILNRFQEDRSLKDWQGIVIKNDQRFFVRMLPIFMDEGCIRCHATPENAPASLIRLYGSHRGFGRKVGDIAGVDVLSFPVEKAMVQIREQAVGIVATGIVAALAAFVLVTALFRRLVVKRIGRLKVFFAEFVSEAGDLSRRLAIDNRDEIGEVCGAFNRMADKLNRLMDERNQLVLTSVTQRERMRSIIDGITDKLMLITPDRSVILANSACMSGNDTALKGLKCYQLINDLPGPCSGCLMERTVDEKVPIFGEVRSGDQEIYLAHYYPILDSAQGDVESVVHYCKSITETKRMELQMMQAEKLASMGQLVAGVAHELNNPLGLILFYAELLKKELPEGSDHLSNLDVITKHTETCKTVVQDLLKFARNMETRPVTGQVNGSVEKVLSVLEKQLSKQGIRIERRLNPDLPMIHMDDGKLQQVWMNILLNAKQAIKNGKGLIAVTTKHDRASGMLSVIIEDNGEGISQEYIHRIFDPFFTTKKTGEGTGLGLSVSYGIVKEHGGDIKVKSQPGAGSTFEVLIPEKMQVTDHA